MQLRRQLKLIILILASATLTLSCEKDNIHINTGNSQNQDGNTGSDGNNIPVTAQCTVYFAANLYDMKDGMHLTRSLNPISADRFITVYTYKGFKEITDYALHSASIGNLLSPDNKLLILEKGEYNLYAPGINTPGMPVPIFAGKSDIPVRNKIDYIWWGKQKVSIDKPATEFTMDMIHCCTQLSVKLDFIQQMNIKDVTMFITPSNTEFSGWNLENGTIIPATDLIGFSEMGITRIKESFYSQMIMIPLRMNGDIDLQVRYVTTGNQTFTLETKIPVYNGELKGGYSYQYVLNISNNQINLQQVNIINWIPVDANDNPIIPIQI